jgi:signal transduction histidine kinase
MIVQAASGEKRPLLRAARLAILLFCLGVVSAYLSFVPDYYERLVSDCLLQGCGDGLGPAPPTTAAALRSSGLTLETYAFFYVAIDVGFTLTFSALALTLLAKARREAMASLAAVMMVALGATFPSLLYVAAEGQESWTLAFAALDAVGWISLFVFFLLFPDGRLVSRPAAAPVALFAAVKLTEVVWPDSAAHHSHWPLFWQATLFLLPIASTLWTQSYRYRRLSAPEQRQQSKWVLYGMTVGFVSFLAISLLFGSELFRTPMSYVYLNAFLHLFLLAIPITLALAVLRKRLWDVDPVVYRTAVYGSLTVCIVAIYGFSIFYFGTWFRAEDDFFPSLLSTAIVAIAFAPLRERLQRIVKRLLKGRHDDPYGTLAELRNLLARPMPPEAMLDTVASFARASLRIPYAAIAIEVGGADRLAASSGTPPSTEPLAFDIRHGGKKTGTLLAAPRHGEPFTAEDQRLLDVLLGHAGPIADNYSMTIGMKLLAEDLQLSREKLVLAREEERRHLRRNLHDELAPRLASLGLSATAAEMYVRRDPERAAELLAELRRVIRSTVEDIRTLVHDMRPAALEEWGLVGALRARIRELGDPTDDGGRDGEREPTSGEEAAPRLRIALEAPDSLPALPAAVEVAAYRIATEALANVARHARASTCSVRLELTERGRLAIRVADDGVGIGPRPNAARRPGGIGIDSMRERAAELGGNCAVERRPGGGTVVTAELPLNL